MSAGSSRQHSCKWAGTGIQADGLCGEQELQMRDTCSRCNRQLALLEVGRARQCLLCRATNANAQVHSRAHRLGDLALNFHAQLCHALIDGSEQLPAGQERAGDGCSREPSLVHSRLSSGQHAQHGYIGAGVSPRPDVGCRLQGGPEGAHLLLNLQCGFERRAGGVHLCVHAGTQTVRCAAEAVQTLGCGSNGRAGGQGGRLAGW